MLLTVLGHAPSRALTQVCHQIRAEFLLVYKRSTVIHVSFEDVTEHMKTWQSDKVCGLLIVDTNRCDKTRCDPASMVANDGRLVFDLTRLVQLRRDNDDFQFYVDVEVLQADRPMHQGRHIEAVLSKTELRVFDWGDLTRLLCYNNGGLRTEGLRDGGLMDVHMLYQLQSDWTRICGTGFVRYPVTDSDERNRCN
jgi:hypothetical protein